MFEIDFSFGSFVLLRNLRPVQYIWIFPFAAFDLLDEEDDDDQDIPAYGFPRNRREPSDIDFIISSAGLCPPINGIRFMRDSNATINRLFFLCVCILQMKIVPYFVSIIVRPSPRP